MFFSCLNSQGHYTLSQNFDITESADNRLDFNLANRLFFIKPNKWI